MMAQDDTEGTWHSAAAEAIAAFPIAAPRLRFWHASENITFRAEDGISGARYVLRLHRPGYNSHAALLSERHWTAALAQAGLTVPQSIATRDGALFARVAIPQREEHRFAGLTAWIDGEVLQHVITRDGMDRADAHFAAVGGLLARMHAASQSWCPPADFSRPALDEDGLMGPQPRWGRFWDHPGLSDPDRADLIAARAHLFARLQALPKDAGHYGMIHADLHWGNALLNSDGMAAIDFDDCGFGWFMYDLAVVLHLHQTSPHFPQLRAALLDGYRRQHPLPGDDALLDLFLLVRDMAEIGWVMQRPELDLPSDFTLISAPTRAALNRLLPRG